jgi:hypothetical protein
MVLHLLKRCCARDPVERPTFEEILVEFDPFLIELDATFRRLVGAEVVGERRASWASTRMSIPTSATYVVD